LRQFGQRNRLGNGRGGRLLHHDVQPRPDRPARLIEAATRRGAERYGIECDITAEHRFDRGKVGDVVERRIAAGNRDKIEIGVCGERRQMLIPRDLAEPNQSDPQLLHACSISR